MTTTVKSSSVVSLTTITPGDLFKVVASENAEFVGKIYIAETGSTNLFDVNSLASIPIASLGNPTVCMIERYGPGSVLTMTV